MKPILVSLLCATLFAPSALADGNRLAYLDSDSPYYPHRAFPKLITPQWVGQDGVEAVIVLAIDDMRGHEKWETYLRPILDRLKQIDGRAPVSVMTNVIDPKDPHLQTWLKEGLSLEVHTIDHPCPLLKDNNFDKAKSTYDRCVDLMNAIPGNKPVAFRMPCCDSLNTPSPRFFAEIFNKATERGHFLTIDSSVFNITTANDPDLPRELVLEKDGRERFRKYLPFDSFVNTIEDYPYPYVINKLCWEFPCAVPSDWEAQNLNKPNSEKTVEDLKAAIDAVVIKKGVFNFVFHPHGWIRNTQVVELIDHVVAKHGKKVKFLTFKDAQERLNKNLLAGHSLRDDKGRDNGVRILDINNDGFMDVVIGNEGLKKTRIWETGSNQWAESTLPIPMVVVDKQGEKLDAGVHFGVTQVDSGVASMVIGSEVDRGLFYWTESGWTRSDVIPLAFTSNAGRDRGARLRDIDHDGRCEFLIDTPDGISIHRWDRTTGRYSAMPRPEPGRIRFRDSQGRDAGLRFVDLNEDGFEDIVLSNATYCSVQLYVPDKMAWAKVFAGPRDESRTPPLPPIVRADGTNNGVWFHSRHLWVQNEDTAKLPNLVDRRHVSDLVGKEWPGPKSPEASLRSIKVKPGFEVELVAAEPLVMDPVSFAWGPDGAFWVVEMADYPLGVDGKGKPGGRIKRLTDHDNDGKYDQATVFVDGLSSPTGVHPWGKGVLITAAPDILYAEDTDDDGVADVKRPVFTGFTPGNQQHRVNGPTYGLDNWLYYANGHEGGNVKSVKTGATVSMGSRDLRVKPDEGLIEPELGPTQFYRARDDWGNWFGNDNTRPLYQFILSDRYLKRNPYFAPPRMIVDVPKVPSVPPVFPLSRTLERFNDPHTSNRITSACSAIIYTGDLFGEAFANNLFVSEPVHNLVHRQVMKLSADGITFSSERAAGEEKSEFLASTDNWFRPTSIRVGPDGALWIADMYRQVIEHPQWIPKDWQAKLDLRAGHDKGRIYRVYPVGKKPRAIPRLDKLSTDQLVAALDSPNAWQRDSAQQMLVHEKRADAVPALKKLAKESTRPQARLQALCTLEGLRALDAHTLLPSLSDPEPGVRQHAIRLAESLLPNTPSIPSPGTPGEGQGEGLPAITIQLLNLVNDASPQVRVQLACTLGQWKSPQAGQALAKLAVNDANHRFISTAVMTSVNANNLTTILAAVTAQGVAPPPGLLENLVRVAAAMNDADAIATALSASVPDSPDAAAFNRLATLLDVLEQSKWPLSKLSQENSERARSAASRANRLLDSARTVATNATPPLDQRIAATRLLGRGATDATPDLNALQSFLTPQSPRELQSAAVANLGQRRDRESTNLLLTSWKGFGPSVRAQFLDLLLNRADGPDTLLSALETSKILPADLDATQRQRLLQHRTARVRERAEKLFAESINPDRQKALDQFLPALKLTGDAKRGADVFTKTCSTCHQLAGVGNNVGPDIASLAAKPADWLLTQILDPNRALDGRYANYIADTKSGLNLSGILTGETGSSITLLAANGETHEVLRSDLVKLRSTGLSLMPEGLESGYSPQDLADLIAFVRASQTPRQRKVFAGNDPQLVTPRERGLVRLTPADAEIYGPTLVLEKQHNNLGYWQHEDDQAAWTIDVPEGGKYSVWIEYSCADDAANNAYVLEAGTEAMRGRVAGTGGWDVYRKVRVGELTLAKGKQQVVLRPDGKPRGALIDLKEVELVPPNKY